jgi:hypothetical protein
MDFRGKEQIPQLPLGTYFQEQISEHMVLLGSPSVIKASKAR